MENKAWAKTLLGIYRYLETICESIDDVVKKTSLGGFGRVNDTKFSAEKLIELTEKKRNLINLKIIIENCLVKLPDSCIRILTLFYLDNVKAKNLSEMYQINIRTFFRRKSVALTKFTNALVGAGYNCIYFLNLLKNEKWILNMYENNLQSIKGNNEGESDYQIILKRAISELKNFTKKNYATF